MSSNRCQGIQRSLGENNHFILYMFEEDIRMIEKWAAEPPYKQPKQGVLLGLWTNTLNPVVHVILTDDNTLPEDYRFFINNPQYLNSSMFSHVGYWYFKDTRVVYNPLQAGFEYRWHKQIDEQRRLVSLEVEQHRFHPILFDEGKEIHGKIEPLPGQNPFWLPDERLSNSTTEEENVEKEKGKGMVALLRDKFESVTSSVSAHWMQRPNNQESASYASVTKQGSQDNQPIVPSNPPGRDGYQASADNNPYPAQCEGEDVYTCTKQNQWYLEQRGQKTLQEISNKLREITNEEPKISRDNDTHNIMILFSFEGKNHVICFPPSFPGLRAVLYCKPIDTRGNRSGAEYSEIKSRDPIQLVGEIIDIISKHR